MPRRTPRPFRLRVIRWSVAGKRCRSCQRCRVARSCVRARRGGILELSGLSDAAGV